mgnify:CR=1 FL=1
MAEITAALVKELREKTGAGMMECKKALTESNGDLEGAIDYLRKKGLSVAAKKASRVASQGLVGVKSTGKKGAIIELNSETDFVAKNDEFQKMALNMVEAALENGDLEAVKAAQLNGKSISENLTDLIAKIGENMSLRRTAALSVENGVVASYIHNVAAPNLGKIGVLVALESSADPARLQEVAKQVAMHIAAAAPQALDIDSMDKAAVEHEKSIYSEQARQSGKPENIIEKMIEGRIRKFYEEVVLLEQAYIMDPDKKVKDVIADASKELGAPVELKGYVRFALGEGIEKKQEDFAAEVNAQLNK